MDLNINKAACRKTLLNLAQNRSHKFTRVGNDVFEYLNYILFNEMRKIVTNHPSMGKTLMMGSKKRTNGDTEEES